MAMSAALDATRRLDWRDAEKEPRRRPGFLAVLGGDDVITVLALRHGTFPEAFVWRGRRFDVWAVQRCWTVSRRGLRGKVECTYFRVRARTGSSRDGAQGTFEIYQNARNGRWHLQRRIA